MWGKQAFCVSNATIMILHVHGISTNLILKINLENFKGKFLEFSIIIKMYSGAVILTHLLNET